MKLIPASSAAVDDADRVVVVGGCPKLPNIMAPRQSGLTLTPVRPSVRYSMADSPPIDATGRPYPGRLAGAARVELQAQSGRRRPPPPTAARAPRSGVAAQRGLGQLDGVLVARRHRHGRSGPRSPALSAGAGRAGRRRRRRAAPPPPARRSPARRHGPPRPARAAASSQASGDGHRVQQADGAAPVGVAQVGQGAPRRPAGRAARRRRPPAERRDALLELVGDVGHVGHHVADEQLARGVLGQVGQVGQGLGHAAGGR